jgi:hypothetical protein
VAETQGGDAAGCASVGLREVTPQGAVTATGQACPMAGPHLPLTVTSR